MPTDESPEFRSTFGLYRSSALIGQGGAGRVYRCQDDSGGLVAVKVLDPAKATRERLRRFKNEIMFV